MNPAVTVVGSQAAFLRQLAALPRKQADDHVGTSAAWLQRVLPLWPQGDFHLGLRLSAQGGGTAGLVALSRDWRTSPLSRRHRSLGFNEASSSGHGCSSVEANGLLGCPPGALYGWVDAVLQELLARDDWDELRVSALAEPAAAQFAHAAARFGLIQHVYSRRQSYWVDFAALPAAADGYLASRSANTRQQLRSALKRTVAERGAYSLRAAASLAEGHAWLDALALLHRKRWPGQSPHEGFANPAFARFHHTLLEQMLGSGEIEILRAQAGDSTLAYLYSLVVDGRVYFDLGAADYDGTERLRPGLVAHWQAIEQYRRRGMRIYDFQAGTHRYKRSLATHEAPLVDLILRRPLLKFRIEEAARRLKRRWHQSRTSSA